MNFAYAKRLTALLCFLVATTAFAVVVNGELKRARLENQGSDPTCNATWEGRVYYNTGSDVAKFCTGAAWRTIADTTATLSNPMDSDGDLIYGGASGAATKLDNGSSGQLLMANGAAAPTWVNTITGAKTFSDNVTVSGVINMTSGSQSIGAAATTILSSGLSEPRGYLLMVSRASEGSSADMFFCHNGTTDAADSCHSLGGVGAYTATWSSDALQLARPSGSISTRWSLVRIY